MASEGDERALLLRLPGLRLPAGPCDGLGVEFLLGELPTTPHRIVHAGLLHSATHIAPVSSYIFLLFYLIENEGRNDGVERRYVYNGYVCRWKVFKPITDISLCSAVKAEPNSPPIFEGVQILV